MASMGTFVWYELVTDDLVGARRFYEDVVGWEARDSGQPDMTYLLLHAGAIPIAGLMEPPPGAPRDGFTPFWLGYVAVPDVDACATQAEALGGKIHAAPMDIAGVGRFAVIVDPQGAIIVPFKGEGHAATRVAARYGRPRRMARTRHDRLGGGVRLLRGAVRLDQGRGHRHGADGHLSAVRRRRRVDRRDDE